MKKIFSAIVLFLVGNLALMAQAGDTPVPRFEKQLAFDGGPSVYLLKGTDPYEKSLSDDGSEVYTAEGSQGEYNFASIVVRFVPPMKDASPEDMEGLLVGYLEFLQTQFGVTEAAGVGRGHTKESLPDVRGVIDYWVDADGLRYAIKGWVDQNFLGVQMIYGPDEYPIFNAQQMFLDGFRFPGE
jgi:hypothetical protein